MERGEEYIRSLSLSGERTSRLCLVMRNTRLVQQDNNMEN